MGEREPLYIRSLLFVPGHKEKMIQGAVRMGADAVVVDLEDAVAPGEKDAARLRATAATANLSQKERARTFLRINPASSPWFGADIAAAASAGLAGIVLPKFDDRAQLETARGLLADAGLADGAIIVGIETARGVHDCYDLLEAPADALYFGAEDYIADLGGRRSSSGVEALFARSKVRLAARLRSVPAIDQAVVAVHDVDKYRLDAGEGRDMGYFGKICLHPIQVELANEIFSPSLADIAHAERVLEAARTGAGSVDGEMVDEVHVRMARSVLARGEGLN